MQTQQREKTTTIRASRRDLVDPGYGVSVGTTNLAGHSVRVSEGAHDAPPFQRPFGECEIDGRKYWLVPQEGTEVARPRSGWLAAARARYLRDG